MGEQQFPFDLRSVFDLFADEIPPEALRAIEEQVRYEVETRRDGAVVVCALLDAGYG